MAMDYPYENLNPERFQEFCEALLAKNYPDMQCFPVGQPDGGRDSLSYFFMEGRSDFIVFQVKFVRNPTGMSDPHKWLTETLEDEAPKIKKQLPKGASRYVLMTNVRGTSHPEVGSIDKAQELLGKYMGIPSLCWWRDDISRHLDGAYDIKWVYPELMTGPDLIRAIVESSQSEARGRRASTMLAFVKGQYMADREIKFKQVDLQNDLLDLFIDVPIVPLETPGPKRRGMKRHGNIYFRITQDIANRINLKDHERARAGFIHHRSLAEGHEEWHVGAATLLLHPLTQTRGSRIVLEGAPGQGKSTIVQYVCQVHRKRILRKQGELEAIPEYQQSMPVRLPVKVDLRDLANWLAKKNPFDAETRDKIPERWHKSLESFLAALIQDNSGGSEFSVQDLIEVAKVSSILLVLDGLDEVADISRRKEVVDEIIKGVNRLEENAASLQLVVTSRPAAFANSPGLPEDQFPYYELGSVTRPLIDEYAGRWSKARRLGSKESAEVKRILKEKLYQPHMRDLARNPMQLAILLSLIHTRGSSLPDKRTSLYDNYVELFFNREAEKSKIVREHRDLLIDIHRYLAWILHTETEIGNETGSITEERLLELLECYLCSEGHDPDLSHQLFSGIVERVVALVSRVEGTFEFEVQPLREYFAARYLYETAPYSPAGDEKRGTKPDRFDAIAQNFYWLNVTRFYAGCYSKGELPSLIDRLLEMTRREGYCLISHPRILAATLLSDWVFAQHPKLVKNVVDIVLDEIGLRHFLATTRRGRNQPFVLPDKCGNAELLAHCFSLLQGNPPSDLADDIIQLINHNGSAAEVDKLWGTHAVTRTGDEKRRWIRFGLQLGCLGRLPLDELSSIISRDDDRPIYNSALFSARRFDYLTLNEENYTSAIHTILEGGWISPQRRPLDSSLLLLSNIVDISRYASSFNEPRSVALSDLWRSSGNRFVDLSIDHLKNTEDFTESHKILALANVAITESKRSSRDWSSSITPWEIVVEKGRELWGDRRAFSWMANIGSAIKSASETCSGYADLLDHSSSLCRRVRYARLRAGQPKWWLRQFNKVETAEDAFLVSLVFFSWASTNTICRLIQDVDRFIVGQSRACWMAIDGSVRDTCLLMNQSARDVAISYNLNGFPKNLNERTISLLTIRATRNTKGALYRKYLQDYDGSCTPLLRFCQDMIMDRLLLSPPDWKHQLTIVSRNYAKGITSGRSVFYRLISNSAHKQLSHEIATEIASNPHRYPGLLVAVAEERCRNLLASTIVPVGVIAKQDGWFDYD